MILSKPLQMQKLYDLMPDGVEQEIIKGAFLLMLDHLGITDDEKRRVKLEIENEPFNTLRDSYKMSASFPHHAQPDYVEFCE
jgi:hypothetical protein